MLRTKIVAGGLAVVLFGIPGLAVGQVIPAATAPAYQGLTIERAAHEAVAWHPSIVESVSRLNAQEEEVDAARAGYLPQISAGIGTGYESLGGARWRPRANVSASQMLYDFGKVSSSVAFARAGVAAGEAEVLLAVDMLIRDTSYAVVEIQRSAALRQVAVEQLNDVRELYLLVRSRYEQGAATRSDALQAEARVQSAEATIQQIDAEYQRWTSNLAFLIGRDAAPDVAPDVTQEFLTSCEQGEPDWTRVPAIMQVQAQRDQAVANLERNRAERWPTVSVQGGGATDVNDPFSGRAEYNFGINITSAIYNGGANSARVRGASFALAAADAAEGRIRNEVNRLLAEAQRQVASFSRVTSTLAEREASMLETGRLYRLQYLEMGTRTLVDLLNAQQELHQVRFDLVNTRHDLRRLQVDCLYSSGTARAALGLSGQIVEGTVL